VADSATSTSDGGDAMRSPGSRRRRPPSPAETARRKAWAAEQAKIGLEWKRAQQARETR